MPDAQSPPAPSSRRNPWRCPAWRRATPRCAPSARPAMTCIIAATTSWTSPPQCEFEEIAYLLVHEKLPNRARTGRLQGQAEDAARIARRGERRCSSSCPRPAIRWMCCAPAFRRWAAASPRRTITSSAGARDIADRLLACLGSMLCYWHHYARDGRRIDVQTDDDSIGAHFLHLLHGRKPAGILGARHAHLAESVRRA